MGFNEGVEKNCLAYTSRGAPAPTSTSLAPVTGDFRMPPQTRFTHFRDIFLLSLFLVAVPLLFNFLQISVTAPDISVLEANLREPEFAELFTFGQSIIIIHFIALFTVARRHARAALAAPGATLPATVAVIFRRTFAWGAYAVVLAQLTIHGCAVASERILTDRGFAAAPIPSLYKKSFLELIAILLIAAFFSGILALIFENVALALLFLSFYLGVADFAIQLILSLLPTQFPGLLYRLLQYFTILGVLLASFKHIWLGSMLFASHLAILLFLGLRRYRQRWQNAVELPAPPTD